MKSPWKSETELDETSSYKVRHEFSEEIERSYDVACKVVKQILKQPKEDALSTATVTLAMVMRHCIPKEDYAERCKRELEVIERILKLAPDKVPITDINNAEED